MSNGRGDNNKNRGRQTFTVHDEIRRDRRIRRAGRMRRARSRMRVLVTVLVCVVICLLLFSAIGASVTRITSVNVVGNERYSTEEILGAARLEGEILPLLSENTVYRRISEICPYVDSVELEKKYPSEITVHVIETEARYALYTRERTLTLDSSLRVMDYTDNIDGLILLTLPEIKSAIEGKRIVFVDEDSAEYVDGMLEEFFAEGRAPWLTELDVTDRFDLRGAAGDKASIIFGDYKNVSEKLTVAEQLLEDAEEEYARYAHIDVSVLSQASLKLEY